MKAFLYKAKGAVAFTVAMSLFGTQAFAAEALSAEEQGVKAAVTVVEEEAPLPQLTLEEAIAKAKKSSTDLRELQANMDYFQESKEAIYDRIGSFNTPSYEYTQWVSDGWYQVMTNVFTIKTTMESLSLQREVANLSIEFCIRNAYNSILQNEKSLELVRINADIHKQLYAQGQTKHRLGMLSTYDLDKLKAEAEQAAADVTLLEESLNQLYITLNKLMGTDADARYELVYEIEFTPYTMTQTMDQYINDALKNKDLSIELQEMNVENAKFILNYRAESDPNTAPNSKELSYDSEKRTLKQMKEDKAAAIRSTYSKIQQTEAQYASVQADLTKAQADYRTAQVNYQAGNVTKIVVENAEMGVIQTENALLELEQTHDLLIFTFENPTLVAAD